MLFNHSQAVNNLVYHFTVILPCFRLRNLDLDLKIWIFGFPIEHKIRKGILRRTFFNRNPYLTWISINKTRREIPFRIVFHWKSQDLDFKI